MLIDIYQTEPLTRSILFARQVGCIETEDFPDDAIEFAEEHGGDFLVPGEDDDEEV
jgi:hypothetical protein